MNLFNKILIANRGEIAVRIIKSAQKLGIQTVAVYAEIDCDSLHVDMADEAYCLGKGELSDTYLNVDNIVKAAMETGCDALHPGYGFLAESPLLIEACEKAGITFIGPNVKAIQLMGNKIEARSLVDKLRIPITKGITGTAGALLRNAHQIPFPLLVKAAAGGGGKGMRIVHENDNLREILEATAREAKNYFGDGTIYIEQYIQEPRHIEFQILGDNFGNVIHLFERECSIQRRYQKIIEESPSPTLTPEIREKMARSAVKIAKAVDYNSAGTIEFLVDNKLNYYFLEMNTRIQVEHPVTEMVTGTDLVEEQILIAAGNPLQIQQNQIKQNGHAIECRIYAEDPANEFRPSPGKITLYRQPDNSNARVDSSIEKAGIIPSMFDPMISKMIVWGENRNIAIKKSISALKDYTIHGIQTNIPYLLNLIELNEFKHNNISTRFCDEHTEEILQNIKKSQADPGNFTSIIALALYQLEKHTISSSNNVWERIGYWRNIMQMQFKIDNQEIDIQIIDQRKHQFTIAIEGKNYEVFMHAIRKHEVDFRIFNRFYKAMVSHNNKGNWFVSIEGNYFEISRPDMLFVDEQTLMGNNGNSEGSLFAPMPGKVIKINVKTGDRVKRGSVLVVVEAMKMENNIVALEDAIIEKVNVKEGERVDTDLQLIHLKPLKTDKFK